MLTTEQIAAYLADPKTCPYCGHNDCLGTGEVEIKFTEARPYPHARQDVCCNNCDKMFDEVFILASIEEIEV